MAGTKEGGRKAAITNRERYGKEFYQGIGSIGGKKSRGGGFRHMKDHDPEKYEAALRKGIETRRNRDGVEN